MAEDFSLDRGVLTGEEIARQLGCPVNTIYTRLHHARRAFVEIGEKHGWLDVP